MAGVDTDSVVVVVVWLEVLGEHVRLDTRRWEVGWLELHSGQWRAAARLRETPEQHSAALGPGVSHVAGGDRHVTRLSQSDGRCEVLAAISVVPALWADAGGGEEMMIGLVFISLAVDSLAAKLQPQVNCSALTSSHDARLP